MTSDLWKYFYNLIAVILVRPSCRKFDFWSNKNGLPIIENGQLLIVAQHLCIITWIFKELCCQWTIKVDTPSSPNQLSNPIRRKVKGYNQLIWVHPVD